MGIINDLISELIQSDEQGGSVDKKKFYSVPTNGKNKGVKNIEEEQALIISSDKPQDVVDKIANRKSLEPNLSLSFPVYLTIKDTYYDTPSKDIKGAKASLRIREIDGVPYLTIKGKNKNDGWTTKSQNRSEWEIKWPYETPSLLDMVDLFGLQKTQIRETARIAKDIYDVSADARKIDKNGVLVAELAIDNILYHFSSGEVARFYEVEIELKGDGCNLPDIVSSLKQDIPELVMWKHSKLSTGNAIELALKVKTNEENLLSKESFTALDKIL